MMDLARFLGPDGRLPDFDMLEYMGATRDERKLLFFLELLKMPRFMMLAGARPAHNIAEAYRPEGVPW